MGGIVEHLMRPLVAPASSCAGCGADKTAPDRLDPKPVDLVEIATRHDSVDLSDRVRSSEGSLPHADELMGRAALQEQIAVARLSARDREVRAHEQAHLAAAGNLATGGASLTYTRGPDGRQYATGGEVSIDTSPVPGDPDATIRKSEQIRRAALAPARPSAQDRAIAARATQMAAKARAEKLREDPEPQSTGDPAEGFYQNAIDPGTILNLLA